MHRVLRMTLYARIYSINKKRRVNAGVTLTFKRKLKNWHPISRAGAKKNIVSREMATYRHEESKTTKTEIETREFRKNVGADGVSLIKIVTI